LENTAVANIKKMEAELAQKRETLKSQLVAEASDIISKLSELGFSYSLTAGNGAPKKQGRPRKEGHNGLAVG
jgi:hypothetical protein